MNYKPFITFASIITILVLTGGVFSQTTWTKFAGNPILDVGAAGSWEDYGVYGQSILYDQGIYKMWYNGSNGQPWILEIGYATSPDGVTWTKDTSNPLFASGSPGEWDSPMVANRAVSCKRSAARFRWSSKLAISIRGPMPSTMAVNSLTRSGEKLLVSRETTLTSPRV